LFKEKDIGERKPGQRGLYKQENRKKANKQVFCPRSLLKGTKCCCLGVQGIEIKTPIAGSEIIY
jgi:hypothetical protein